MTSREITLAVKEYRRHPERRVIILRRLHAAGGPPAIEAFAHAAGIDPAEMLAWMDRYYRAQRRRRRGKKPLEPVGAPPRPAGEIDPTEAAEVAALCAGGYGERQFARRDASRSTTNKRSRKIR